MYFNGNDIYSTLDNLLALKYKIAILKPNTQKEYMITLRIYKTILKGLDIKYDANITNQCIYKNMIMINKFHENENLKSTLNKSVSIRKLMSYLDNDEIIQLIKSYYKTQNVFNNIEKIKFENVEKSEYDFLKKTNKNVNVKDIVNVELIKKYYNGITYYSFCTKDNKYNNISIQIPYSNFKWTSMNDNVIILQITDNETIKKLVDLHNCMYNIIKKNFKNIYRMSICKLEFKEIRKNIETIYLSVHINKNMKNYDNIIKQIQSSNENFLAKVLCSGKLWVLKNNSSCGIKFNVNDITINKSYNML